MMMMGRRVEHGWHMALGANPVTRDPKLLGVRVVAVRTGNTRRVHAALDEGAPGVDLVTLLPVRVVEARLQQRRPKRIEPVVACVDHIRVLAPAGMAAGTGLDLAGTGPRRRTDRRAGAPRRNPQILAAAKQLLWPMVASRPCQPSFRPAQTR